MAIAGVSLGNGGVQHTLDRPPDIRTDVVISNKGKDGLFSAWGLPLERVIFAPSAGACTALATTAVSLIVICAWSFTKCAIIASLIPLEIGVKL